ncbi:D-mannonate dehydratase [Candidatus Poribacteria bacterium]|nr:D-mannonate dehydratase [Candidatus Poribacteria bacterium]
MKLGVSHQAPDMLTPGRLAYLRQMGVQQVEVRAPSDYCTYDNLVRIREMVEAAGLGLFEVMRSDRYNSEAIALGLPGRDAEMERLKQFLRDLGRAGIDTTTYAWHTGGVYATGSTTTRGCRTRLFELDEALARPNAYDREYSDDELWENYERFIREILPVAEEAGVRLQLHPNDPPVTHQGVARIFRSTDAFARAMELAGHSDHSGILFCVGTWGQMTGEDGHGEDVAAAIRELGSRGHIYQVHFRNVSSTLPDFHETFPEDGYLNMYSIMKALAEVGFGGMVVPDHVPVCEDSDAAPRTGEALVFGYIRALMQAAETEVAAAQA